MAQTGTITLTQNSTAVTGSGTAFTTDLKVGDFITATVGGIVQTLGVSAIASNTSLTLIEPYSGPTTSGLAWVAVPNSTLVGITSQLAAQVWQAIRGYNLDKTNWQQVFSATGTITVTLIDGSTYTGPAWSSITTSLAGKLDKSQNLADLASVDTARTNLGLNAAGAATFGGLELSSSSPFIDFHYNKATTDYSVRLINTEANALEAVAAAGNVSFRINGGLRVGGASYAGGMNLYAGTGDANNVWGFTVTTGGMLTFARGSAATGFINISDSQLQNCRGIMCKAGTSGAYSSNYFNYNWVTSSGTSYLEAWIDTSKVGNVTLSSTSDRQLKKDIAYREDAEDALNQVMQWRPADFKMKARGIIPETETQLGFIANDLIAISPECVSGKGLAEDYDIEEDPNTSDAYYLNHIPLIVKLAQATQAQQKIIDNQAAVIVELQKRMKAIDGLDS